MNLFLFRKVLFVKVNLMSQVSSLFSDKAQNKCLRQRKIKILQSPYILIEHFFLSRREALKRYFWELKGFPKPKKDWNPVLFVLMQPQNTCKYF